MAQDDNPYYGAGEYPHEYQIIRAFGAQETQVRRWMEVAWSEGRHPTAFPESDQRRTTGMTNSIAEPTQTQKRHLQAWIKAARNTGLNQKIAVEPSALIVADEMLAYQQQTIKDLREQVTGGPAEPSERGGDTSFPLLRDAFRTGPFETLGGWAHAIPVEARDEIKVLLAQRDALQDSWNMTHFSCNNPDHAAAYQAGAHALGLATQNGIDQKKNPEEPV